MLCPLQSNATRWSFRKQAAPQLTRNSTRGFVSRLTPCASKSASRTDTLRQLLKSPGILIGPCCHDGLTAKLIEKAGFPFSFMSGFCTSAARLGSPDTGLISYYEMLDQGRNIHEATRRMPIIGDGDTGYGNAINVKRTVRGYSEAGFAGILIEDQVSPKSCGHVRNKRVVSREEAVARIRAAVDARDEGADILIVARTDSRQAVGLEEALWRVQAFADAGADVLFIDALESEEEMRRFLQTAPGVYKMANNLEGGGKTPVLPPGLLEAMGFKLVSYPMSLLGVSIRAMEQALEGLKAGQVPPCDKMGSFSDIQAAVGFPEYYCEEERYAVPDKPTPPVAPTSPPPPISIPRYPTVPGAEAATQTSASSPPPSPPPSTPVVEADAIMSPGGTLQSVSLPATGDEEGSWDRRQRSLRIRITNTATKVVLLETRVPAGFLDSISAIVPQVAGINMEALMKKFGVREPANPSQPIYEVVSGGELVQIFLEPSSST